jgi:maleylpyruvate isomerase
VSTEPGQVLPGTALDLESGPPDPASLLALVDAATGRLEQTVSGLTDADARGPSRLPGWSRGHLLTHLARNADALRNLLTWARTGVVTPPYATPTAREEDIQAGAARPVAALAADVTAASAAFAVEARSVSGAQWQVLVGVIGGWQHPALVTLWRRLQEVEIHHVDLAAGYEPASWSPVFAATALARISQNFARPDCPPAQLRTSDSGAEYSIGPAGADAAIITGPTRQLLAWLIGRGDGSGLTVTDGGPLPVPPPW